MKRPKKNPRPVAGRESDKFILRLPEGMRAKIKVIALQNGRSMNSEVVAALEKYIEKNDLVWNAIEELQNQIDDLKQAGRDLNED